MASRTSCERDVWRLASSAASATICASGRSTIVRIVRTLMTMTRIICLHGVSGTGQCIGHVILGLANSSGVMGYLPGALWYRSTASMLHLPQPDRRAVPPITGLPHCMSQQAFSSLIWSVADLLAVTSSRARAGDFAVHCAAAPVPCPGAAPQAGMERAFGPFSIFARIAWEDAGLWPIVGRITTPLRPHLRRHRQDRRARAGGLIRAVSAPTARRHPSLGRSPR